MIGDSLSVMSKEFHISSAKFKMVQCPHVIFHCSLVQFKGSTLNEVSKMVIMYSIHLG